MKYRYLLIAIPIFFLQTACGDGSEENITSSQLNNNAITTPSVGRLLASQCAQCHGTDGISISEIDSLVGESDEILEEMSEMKGSSKNSIMHLQAKGYSNSEIREIARYFSTLSQGGGNDRDDDKDDDRGNDRDDDKDDDRGDDRDGDDD
jgi:sulfide dehydrogenase cytochrome subunit